MDARLEHMLISCGESGFCGEYIVYGISLCFFFYCRLGFMFAGFPFRCHLRAWQCIFVIILVSGSVAGTATWVHPFMGGGGSIATMMSPMVLLCPYFRFFTQLW